MTNKDIKKYISWLNSGDKNDLIFTRKVGLNVDRAIVWPQNPVEKEGIFNNHMHFHFFFFKNEAGYYVGGVLDMGSDLHWYVLKDYRKQGHLSKALSQTILPYIFLEREEQLLSISPGIGKKHHSNSKKVATSLGFVAVDEEESYFRLSRDDFRTDNPQLEDQDEPLSEERCDILKIRINQAFRILLKVSDELKMRYDTDKDIDDVAYDVNACMMKVEDLHWENKNL